jgi:hypothetical protein
MAATGLGRDEMADTNLPKFNTAIADMLDWPSAIKMEFPQVGMRFYPLRADIVRLRNVCDTYLNFINEPDDRPPVYFKPAAPFVLMQTVNYDKLEIEKIGWLVQHEAIFSIPIEWYELVDKRWVFKDWAMTYPFIYLDHPISIWMGREMYGWPKVPVRVPRLFPLRNPPDPQGRVAFNLATHSRDRVNQPEPFRSFIEIRQEADGLSPIPWSAGELYNLVPRAIAGGLAAASTMVETFSDFFLRKPGRDESAPYPAMLGSGYTYISKWLPEFWTMMVPGMAGGKEKFTASPFMKNNIVLKQFRDAHEIDSACYQALVKSEISINKIIDGGLLFNPLSGDTSGGVTVRLHQFKTQPIVETLGLEVSEITNEHGVNVSSLKPFCPFWWNLNLSYGNASTICWRSRTSKFALPGEKGASAQRKDDYVKLGSGALEEIAGVEKFPKFLMRVLPLKANLEELRKLCNDLFDGVPYSIEPVAPYVLMIADQFREMTSAADPNQGWADSELRFAIVAKCRDRQPAGAERLVILPLINFAGSEWNAISHREVNGRFALASDFAAPPQHGMQDLPPTAKNPLRKLFSLRTSICPTLDEDEQTRRWTLLEVAEETGAAERKEARAASEQWLKDLGLYAIRAENRFEGVALKQFRDATLADRACYQALVLVERKFTSEPEIAWIDEPLKVTIYEFDTMQIVKRFGLVGGTPQIDRNARPCVVFEPEKPFWVRGDMEQGLGINLCWRAGGMDWQRDNSAK